MLMVERRVKLNDAVGGAWIKGGSRRVENVVGVTQWVVGRGRNGGRAYGKPLV